MFTSQDLSAFHDRPVKNATVNLPIRSKRNSERFSCNSLSQLGAQNRDIGAAVVPFVNCRCHFYDTYTYKIFNLLLKAFRLKRKKIATQGRTWTSNPDLSYPNLSPLPLHYHTDPPKFRKNEVHTLANCLS